MKAYPPIVPLSIFTLAIGMLMPILSSAAGMIDEKGFPNTRTKYKGVFGDKEFKEQPITKPAWFNEANLLKLRMPKTLSNDLSYYVDRASINIGSDRVVRYTIVIKGASGSEPNVSYEGIRCTPNGMYRSYYYGLAHDFVSYGDNEWHIIVDKPENAYRNILWRDYFCDNFRYYPLPRQTIIENFSR